MHVKRTRKGEGGQQGSGWRDGNQWVREWPRMNVSTERNRMEPVRGRSLVEAARLDAPERLQSPPGLCQCGPSKEYLLGKDSGTVVHGTFSARSMPA
jgi:hypothetical protein